MMYLVFQFTFAVGQYPMDWLEAFFGWLGRTVNEVWPIGQAEFLQRLLVEGTRRRRRRTGFPARTILLLFLSIAILEGTGYMARAAFIMDGFMHKFGLHGKSFFRCCSASAARFRP